MNASSPSVRKARGKVNVILEQQLKTSCAGSARVGEQPSHRSVDEPVVGRLKTFPASGPSFGKARPGLGPVRVARICKAFGIINIVQI